MRLLEFMRSRGLSDEAMAEIIGGSATAQSVRKWKYGATPRSADIRLIEQACEGLVTRSDFRTNKKTDLSKIISQKRVSLGWSKTQLAHKANTDFQAVHRIENGHHSKYIFSVLQTLGLDINGLEFDDKSAADIATDMAEEVVKNWRQMGVDETPKSYATKVAVETVLKAIRLGFLTISRSPRR